MEESTLAQEFDVVCLGGGVAGEAIAGGLEGSGRHPGPELDDHLGRAAQLGGEHGAIEHQVRQP